MTAYIVANKGGKWVADLAWENPQLSMSFSNAVLIGDAVFSMSPLNSEPVLLGRCEDRQDALGIGAASGRERHHPVGRSALRPQRRWDADDRKSDAWCSVCACQDVYRSNERHVGASGDLGNQIFVKDVDTLSLWTLN